MDLIFICRGRPDLCCCWLLGWGLVHGCLVGVFCFVFLFYLDFTFGFAFDTLYKQTCCFLFEVFHWNCVFKALEINTAILVRNRNVENSTLLEKRTPLSVEVQALRRGERNKWQI